VRNTEEQRIIANFKGSLIQTVELLLRGMHKGRDGREGLDEHRSQRVAAAPCMETVIEEIQEALETACGSSFRIRNISQKAKAHKSVPFWTQYFTILRIKINGKRRKFQLTNCI